MTVRAGLALVGVICAWPSAAAVAQPAAPSAVSRLMVMDMPYVRVWDGAVHALSGYELARAADGVIETARVERAPRPDEPGADRVAERVTVRVEAVGERITRVTVSVSAEAFRDGGWRAVEPSPATAREVIERIRAGLG